MIRLRPSEERGHIQLGWLDSRHSFSFGHYHDARHMGHSALRVINQDRVKPGTGFAAHSHDNMEILSLVRRGAITHRDSMGNEVRLPAGEFQLMSAGSGITHSEHNREHEELEFLQIWLQPNVRNSEPRYQQKRFPEQDGLQLILSPDGEQGSLLLRQQARLYHGRVRAGTNLPLPLQGPHGWLQMLQGRIRLNALLLQDGDGAAISQPEALQLNAETEAEFLFFDLP